MGFYTLFILVSWLFYTIKSRGDHPVTCEPGQYQVLFNSADFGKASKGVFSSPGWPETYRNDTRCLYRFLADSGQKVKVTFSHFNIEGYSNECIKDFLDIYIDVASSDPSDKTDTEINSRLRQEVSSTTTTPSSANIIPTLIRSVSLGRFCGHSLTSVPNVLVSLHRELLLDFYGDNERKRCNQDLGFNGTFEFIPDDNYYPGKAMSKVTIPIPWFDSRKQKELSIVESDTASCRFLIKSPEGTDQITGTIYSPTYPGLHPANLACAYQFKTLNKYQRIKVTVKDLFTAEHLQSCIYDSFEVYDGDSTHSPRIMDPLCGVKKDLTFYSTSDSLLVIATFGDFGEKSEKGEIDKKLETIPQYRGYWLEYEINSNFIRLPRGLIHQHIKGTECDFQIISTGQLSGTISFPEDQTSENYRQLRSLNKDCSFIFLGLHNTSVMEVVSINFDELQLPMLKEGSTKCGNNFIGVYGNRKILTKLDPASLESLKSFHVSKKIFTDDRNSTQSFEFCQLPNADISALLKRNLQEGIFISEKSTFVVKLRTEYEFMHESPRGVQFKLGYRFTKDFGIPGIKVNPEQCQLVYNSTDQPQGTVMYTYSPFYPDNYPKDFVCVYLFVPKPGEVLRLIFNSFTIANNQGNCTQEDYLQAVEIRGKTDEKIYRNLVTDASEINDGPHNDSLRWTLTYDRDTIINKGSYCGDRSPGPILSSPEAKAVILRFRSDAFEEASGYAIGFDFIEKPGPLENHVVTKTSNTIQNVCRGNLVALNGSGILLSPNFPSNYPSNLNCEWKINTNNNGIKKGILLHFVEFSLEGTPLNCSNAQVKIYEEASLSSSMKICGADSFVKSYFNSSASYLRVVFQTSNNAIGSRGFKMVWTELLPNDSRTNSCANGFTCQVTKHCISKNLQCDGVPNCGTFRESPSSDLAVDNSDEASSCLTTTSQGSLQIGIGVFLTIVIMALLIIFMLYRENGRKSRKANSFQDPMDAFPDSKAFITDQLIIGEKKAKEQKKAPLMGHDELAFPQAKDFMVSDSPPKHRHIYQVEDMTKRSSFKPFKSKSQMKKSYDQLDGLFSPSVISESSYNPYSPRILSSTKRNASLRSINQNNASSKNIQYMHMENSQTLSPRDKFQKISMV